MTLKAEGVVVPESTRRLLEEGVATTDSSEDNHKVDHRGKFAVFNKSTDSESAVLNIPALRLKLNLNKFRGDGVTHVTEEQETQFIRDGEKCPADANAKKAERNSVWNYDEHGADWPDLYPDCGLPS